MTYIATEASIRLSCDLNRLLVLIMSLLDSRYWQESPHRLMIGCDGAEELGFQYWRVDHAFGGVALCVAMLCDFDGTWYTVRHTLRCCMCAVLELICCLLRRVML
mmetsp:Transcript_21941/g.66677  ORF Transcript_21941/g.66677 Transcript_21941/m.66677 type:complete len:105 (+) Transcript_21941:752-1066(+)